MIKQRLILNLVLISILLTGCKGGWGNMPPPAVEAAPVSYGTWQPQVFAVGTLSANQGVVIKPEVSGRITGIYFRSGDYVKAGTLLVQLNPDILNAQLVSSQAKVALSKANYMRILELFKKKVAAKQDLDTALSQYQSDEGDVIKAQAQLNQLSLRAPFSGRLGLRQVDLGDYVAAGDAITNLNAIDPLRVDFRVPEVYLSQIKSGQMVLIHSSAYPHQTFDGHIYGIDSQIDTDTRSLAVRASIPNKDQKLLPGGFVDVLIQSGIPQKVIWAPETAINLDADGQFVYKVVDGKAVKVKVTTGNHKDGNVTILQGLAPGDVIITVGGFKVTDGGAVSIGK